MENVTTQMVAEHRDSTTKPLSFKGLREAKALTPHRESILARVHGMRLAFIARPLFWDKDMERLGKRDHKTVLELLYGGHVLVYEVRGDLPGDHPPSRVGSRAGKHYLLMDSRSPIG